jgi:hypothetical protein
LWASQLLRSAPSAAAGEAGAAAPPLLPHHHDRTVGVAHHLGGDLIVMGSHPELNDYLLGPNAGVDGLRRLHGVVVGPALPGGR